MASIPLKVIEDLYYKARYNPGKWYKGGRGYEMYGFPNGSIKLSHYGTVIYEYKAEAGTTKVGGYSMSDAAAINSMVALTGHGAGAYIDKGELYQVGTGRRFPATVVPLNPIKKAKKKTAKRRA